MGRRRFAGLQDFASLRLVVGWLSLLSLSFFSLFLAASRGGPSAGVAPVSRGSRHNGRAWIERDRVADLDFYFLIDSVHLDNRHQARKWTKCTVLQKKQLGEKRGVEIDCHTISVSRGTAGDNLEKKSESPQCKTAVTPLCQSNQ